MDTERAFFKLAFMFSIITKTVELKIRHAERDALDNRSKILIVSAPTDIALKMLSGKNKKGETHYLAFSSRLENIARKFSNKHCVENLNICTEPFFKIPFDDEYFDFVFANCFFDFCNEQDFDVQLSEIKRVLKDKGKLHAPYLDYPSNLINRLVVGTLGIPIVGYGIHPVDAKPALLRQGLKLDKDISMQKFGFPLRYIQAAK